MKRVACTLPSLLVLFLIGISAAFAQADESHGMDATLSYLEATDRLALQEKAQNPAFYAVMDRYKEVTGSPDVHDTITFRSMREMVAVMQHVDSTGSNLVIVQTPSSSNSYTLIIRPVRPELESRVTVTMADGQLFWQGNVTDETVIPLGGIATKSFFLQGLGNPVTVMSE